MQIVCGDERKNELNCISFPIYAKTKQWYKSREIMGLWKKGENKIEDITWRPRPCDPEIATQARVLVLLILTHCFTWFTFIKLSDNWSVDKPIETRQFCHWYMFSKIKEFLNFWKAPYRFIDTAPEIQEAVSHETEILGKRLRKVWKCFERYSSFRKFQKKLFHIPLEISAKSNQHYFRF